MATELVYMLTSHHNNQEDILLVSPSPGLVSHGEHQPEWSGVRGHQSPVSSHNVSQSTVSANRGKVRYSCHDSLSSMFDDCSEDVSSMSCADKSAEQCSMTVAAMTNTVHFLTIDNVHPGQLPVSLAISITLSGCKEEGYSEGAMMVNSINTASLCGQANRRPLKILFQPSSGQPPLDTCGPG